MIYIILLTVLSAVFLYMLFIPVKIYFEAGYENHFRYNMEIRFFPFKIRLKPDTLSGIPFMAGKEKKTPHKTDYIQWFSLVTEEYKPAWKILTDIIIFVSGVFLYKGKYININISGSFFSPDITGFISGLLWSLTPLISSKVNIKYEPDFLSSGLKIRADAELASTVFSFILNFTRFCFRVSFNDILRIKNKIRSINYDSQTQGDY